MSIIDKSRIHFKLLTILKKKKKLLNNVLIIVPIIIDIDEIS